MLEKFKRIMARYPYAAQLAPGGFVIDGKPALTKIDGGLIGDYVIMVVRDPLLDYGGDPAEFLSQRLENRVLAGRSGMFTTYSGRYKGAHISIVSGGSG
ncbi:MAG: uridine phosphorylase, partial [Roseburia sp.]|nr:uridine phosphorylase [Roseburia sp.]